MAAECRGEYWLVSIPKEDNDTQTVADKLRREAGRYCTVNTFEMPPLQVGSVNQLLNLNDTIQKYDVFGRSLLNKLVRAYREYNDTTELPKVKDRNLYRFIPEFTWDKAYFNVLQKLPELSKDIHTSLGETYDRLKVFLDKYKAAKAKLTAEERASEGNLMVCDLQQFVKQTDFIDGDFLTTALVVVPTNRRQQFEETYWKLDDTEEAETMWSRENQLKQQMIEDEEANEEEDNQNITFASVKSQFEVVVPESLSVLEEQDDFVLYRVVLLKKGVQWFKNICREFRYSVRDFVFKNESEQQDGTEAYEELVAEEQDKKTKLIRFSHHTFPDVVKNWMHLKIIRVFIEAVLRFGLPTENFATFILEVNQNRSEQLNMVLTNAYKHLRSEDMGTGTEEEASMMGMAELRPYVYIPLDANFD